MGPAAIHTLSHLRIQGLVSKYPIRKMPGKPERTGGKTGGTFRYQQAVRMARKTRIARARSFSFFSDRARSSTRRGTVRT